MMKMICDPTRPNAPKNEHDYEYIDDEYDSLANGGSYAVYRCRVCGRVAYSPLPD